MLVIFTKLDENTTAIYGTNLISGEIVTATTKGGKDVDVIVGDIISTDTSGGMTALFEWIDEEVTGTIFVRHDNEWIVRVEGEAYGGDLVEVVQRDGSVATVTLTEVLFERDGYTYAGFEKTEINNGQPYFHRLNDKQWVVRGRDLAVGQTIEVSTRTGEPKTVTITKIIAENDGLMDAMYTSE